MPQIDTSNWANEQKQEFQRDILRFDDQLSFVLHNEKWWRIVSAANGIYDLAEIEKGSDEENKLLICINCQIPLR